ncbi:MAG TPA: prolipoprotein diacylglyceryl transferase [Rhizomicrobium sp.]|nr:prolipoprotein diacylglyceryl transferase [Rhizomicrobium sp.]
MMAKIPYSLFATRYSRLFMALVIPFYHTDPVLLHIWGPLEIRWYALAYLAGILIGWWLVLRMVRQKSLWTNPPFNGQAPATADDIGDLVVWVTLGVIVGGRLGYVLIYGILLCGVTPDPAACGDAPMMYVTRPWTILEAWNGGMSFHGAALGVILAIVSFCRRRGLRLLSIGDLICAVQPVGQFFGRLANYNNGELWGKPSDVPWAMIFPRAPGGVPRHPSQIYEAALEGLLLFAVLQAGIRVFRWHERPGLVSAVFLIGYAVTRYICEFFREPDAPFLAGVSMGQALSILFFLGGLFVLWLVRRKPAGAGA